MRRAALILALAASLAPACKPGGGTGKERAVATPTVDDAFRIQFEFMAKQDVDGLWAIYSDGMRARMDAMVANLRKLTPQAFQNEFGFPRDLIEGRSTREVLRALARSPKLKHDGLDTPKIARRQEQGEITVVQFLQRGRKCQQGFRKVGGNWKVDAPIDCRSLNPLGPAGGGHDHDHDHGAPPPPAGRPVQPGPAMTP